MKNENQLNILMEMRPALDGYAGIPQETRLLFRGLCMIDSIEVEGLLQTSHQFLASGTKTLFNVSTNQDDGTQIHRTSRVIISIETQPATKSYNGLIRYLKKQYVAYMLTFSALFLPYLRKIAITGFKSRFFEDFVWRTLFAKSLHPSDFSLVTNKNYRVCSIPWNVMQTAGLNSLKYVSKPAYPVLDTSSIDVFITQTPYPGRVDKNTSLVVRYHDALPVFMPHTIAHKSRHEATHYYALMSNVQSGAYFACVSESTREDLLRLFPEVQDRAVTIHNMVSHHFYTEDSDPKRIRQIIRARTNLTVSQTSSIFKNFDDYSLDDPGLNYLLVVSTIEPRKNHSRLIAAWEHIRAEMDSDIKLVIVGGLGWDYEVIVGEMRTWLEQGALFVLSNVPADDLRVLYRHADATVCPSLAEGFDYSGVESMRCGGVVIASDIPVHREIYLDAAEYFDPYCTKSLIDSIKKVLFDLNALEIQNGLRVNAKIISARYLPENILPKWEDFLGNITKIQDNKGVQ